MNNNNDLQSLNTFFQGVASAVLAMINPNPVTIANAIPKVLNMIQQVQDEYHESKKDNPDLDPIDHVVNHPLMTQDNIQELVDNVNNEKAEV
jgi:hypothetical protein